MSSTDPLRSIAEQLSLFRLPEAPVPVTPAGSEGLLQFGTRIVPYRLRRRARARLALVIADHGLRINAPSTLPLRDIEAFAHQHGEWIVRKLDQQATAPRPQQLVIADGTRLPLLGAEAIVRVLPGHNRTRWIGNTLVIEARPHARLNLLAQRGLQKQALAHFSERLAHHAPLMGLEAPPLGLSSARTRWGSCSLHSGIRLNWRLIHLPPELGDYVVVHELAHLYQMNHSKRFWAIVEHACPDWREARAALKLAAGTLTLI
ncbi:MAG: M48 family metallopeptidase [Rhodocyclaceae bacterium]|jgi:predicted metal-dependent hydrolase|nr:M48 family metallopeptidase [Rhodocyclaceae bacterium]MBK6908451.1 M48 family metallopeptidase [Rhodocyclaceae bacterium]